MEENLKSLLDLTNPQLGEAERVPVLTLAFIGDAVYELLVRTYILDRETKIGKLHRKSSSMVKAQAQAKKAKEIKDFLRPEEEDILRRGRNAHPKTRAKNADVQDYRLATGFEALMGYLYLKGEKERLLDLFQRMWMEWRLNY